ncbi:hypothetical protein HYS92_02130 [Candidatus Daviesbacteria bacterium]|nr:hypothetical protein [Candidatus Daviesbacteria bacterium]
MNQKGLAHIILIIILVIGLIAVLYLVQHPQIFKPKASSNPVLDAFEIKDAEGNLLTCDSNASPPVCTTSTEEVTITVKDLEALIPE